MIGDCLPLEPPDPPVISLSSLSAALAEHRDALQNFLVDWFAQQDLLLSNSSGLDLDVDGSDDGEVISTATCQSRVASWSAASRPSATLTATIAPVAPTISTVHTGPPTRQGGERISLAAKNSFEAKFSVWSEAHKDHPQKLNAEDILANVDLSGAMRHMSKVDFALGAAVDAVHDRTSCGLCRVAEALEHHPWFHVVCSVVILLNAAFLIFSTELRLANRGAPNHMAINVVELFFCCFYTTELCLKLLGQRLTYFCGQGSRWNWFDMGLVLLSLVETVSTFASGGSGLNVSYLRVLRLVKMLKLLRFVRIMRQFRELRLVLDSILGSMKCMWYACLLTAIMALMFSLCFAQAVIDLFLEGPDATETDLDNVLLYWGSIGTSMVSLFQACTGGESWAYVAAPLMEIGVGYYAIFMLYVSFFQFVFMNSMTSVFVDSMQLYSESAAQDVIRDQMDKRQEYVNTLVAMFRAMDSECTGEITFQNFKEILGKPDMLAFAASLDLEVFDLEQFFAILSSDGRRKVDLETFVMSCIRLRGSAQRIDVTELLLQQERTALQLARFEKRTNANFKFSQKAMI